jgi:sulfur-oxidizing protein SoxX
MRFARCGIFALLVAFAGPAAAQVDEGRAFFVRADKGYCIACHQVPDGAGPATRADLGPRLDGARLKGWDRARLRELLADPTRTNPDSVMPPYGRHRILQPAEIERVIDFLHALP